MDAKNSSEISDSNNRVYTPINQTPLNRQTLAELAAKAANKSLVREIESKRDGEKRKTTTTTQEEKICENADVGTSNNTTPATAATTATPPTPAINDLLSIGKAIDNPHLTPHDANDKPLSQKSLDSDCTLQSDQSSTCERNAFKALAGGGAAATAAQTPFAAEKTFANGQTLNRILLAHTKEQGITTTTTTTTTAASVELDRFNTNPAAPQAAIAGVNVVGGVNAAVGNGASVVADCISVKKGTIAFSGDAAVFGETGNGEGITTAQQTTPTCSVRSIGSLVCRICHNAEQPERLVSPCLCKGSLTYVHVHCLERWISTSRSTVCELCQFQYNTVQTLRYTCLQSLRMWYSRSMSRRALQEDCQMFSLLTLVAFGIIGTLLVGIQYYFLHGQTWGLSQMWTKGWLIFFLFTTLTIYFVNVYMILKSQLSPWYRWWQSARDIKLILENRKPFQLRSSRRLESDQLAQELSEMMQQQQEQEQQQQLVQQPILPQAMASPASPAAQQTQSQHQPNRPTMPANAAISIPIPIHKMALPPIAFKRNHLPIISHGIDNNNNYKNNNNNSNNNNSNDHNCNNYNCNIFDDYALVDEFVVAAATATATANAANDNSLSCFGQYSSLPMAVNFGCHCNCKCCCKRATGMLAATFGGN